MTQRRIAENLARVRARIEDAAIRAGRQPTDVTLVGVTKYVDVATTEILYQCGCLDLGENRPQSLWDKADALTSTPVRWHLIGSLQRNKAARTIAIASLIHSIDSIKLAESVSRLALEQDKKQPVLLEVNISGESAKHGFTPDELVEVAVVLNELPGIEIQGLMAMAALECTETETGKQFAMLRELRDRARNGNPNIKALSMGMSGDFEIAIAEGATIVRIGSLLFE